MLPLLRRISALRQEIVGAEPAKLKLYSYWRSSCSQRVRIALNLKGLDYEYKAVNLLKDGQFDPEFEKLNPVKYVPALVDGDVVVGDSLAITLYLEDKYPQHPLLPKDLKEKALNLQVASIVGSSIQPLQNLSILKFIETNLMLMRNLSGFNIILEKAFLVFTSVSALEKLLKDVPGKYATGNEVLLADVFLAPQIHAGVTRFGIDMTEYPRLARAHAAYSELPAFQAALPERQPDYPAST